MKRVLRSGLFYMDIFIEVYSRELWMIAKAVKDMVG